VDDLSVCALVHWFVDASVGLSSALWKNGGSDPDAVWHHMAYGSRDEAGSVVWGSVHGKVLLRANLGRAIVTNGYCTAYMCDSAATQPSSQITLGRLVMQWQKFTYFCQKSTKVSQSIDNDLVD